jgi:hypothetical protein
MPAPATGRFSNFRVTSLDTGPGLLVPPHPAPVGNRRWGQVLYCDIGLNLKPMSQYKT